MRNTPDRDFGPHLWHVDSNGCWIWRRAHARYGHYTSRIADRPRLVLAHRRAYEVFVGPIPEGMCVLHRCDVPRCINPAPLFIGTLSDNAKDRELKGRGVGAKRFNQTDVERIRDMARSGVRNADIAKLFCTSPQYVGALIRRKTWNRIL